MSNSQEINQRINNLEVQLSHQENTIQELSDITAKQWETIDSLVRKIDALKEQILSLEEDSKTLPAGDPPPPHF